MRGWESRFRTAEALWGEVTCRVMDAGASAEHWMAAAGARQFLVPLEAPGQRGSVWIPWGGWEPAAAMAIGAEPLPLFRQHASSEERRALERWAEAHALWLLETLRRFFQASAPLLERVWLAPDESLSLRLVQSACLDAGVLATVGDAHSPAPETAASPPECVVPASRTRERAGELLLGPLLGDHPPTAPAPLGSVASHLPAATTTHVARQLGFDPVSFSPDRTEAVTARAFYKWGVRQSRERARLDWWAQRLGRPMLVLEDGVLLRSIGIGQGDARDAAMSITLDPCTAYYDATRASRYERLLTAGAPATPTQRSRAADCIAEIRRRRLSKYNNAPDTGRSYGPPGRPRILLVDQHRRDASVRYGLASEASFDAMLQFAVTHRPDHTLLLKRHPDAVQAGSKAYFTPRRLARHGLPGARGVLVDDNVNPHTLLDQVDEVFVVTSGLGFEALMAGVPVRCFGTPFYAGFGLTQDHQAPPRRRPPRELEEIFHAIAIASAQYLSTDGRGLLDIEQAIEQLAHLRDSGSRPR